MGIDAQSGEAANLAAALADLRERDVDVKSRDEAIAWVKSYPFPWPDVTLELRALACPLPH